jgi:TonB family protein
MRKRMRLPVARPVPCAIVRKTMRNDGGTGRDCDQHVATLRSKVPGVDRIASLAKRGILLLQVALSERAKDLGVSIALHAAIGAVIFAFASGRVLREAEEEEVYVDMEIMEPELPPIEEPTPPAPDPEIPTIKRPEVVPKAVVTKVIEKARPFQAEAENEEGERDAPEDAEAIAAPTTTLSFAMTETVGGGSGLEYSSTTGGSMALPPPGPAGGAPGLSNAPGASNVKVARDWQVTRQAQPTNDRSFEPTYPPLAKRQGREAVVVVRLDIDASGRVVKAEPIEGPERHGFREAAIAYARKLEFAPAMAGDAAVASRIEWTVHFYVRN